MNKSLDYSTIAFLPDLRGAPLSCLVAMMLYPQQANFALLLRSYGGAAEAVEAIEVW